MFVMILWSKHLQPKPAAVAVGRSHYLRVERRALAGHGSGHSIEAESMSTLMLVFSSSCFGSILRAGSEDGERPPLSYHG